VLWEIVGVAASVAFAVVALAHALAGPKRSLLLTDGDSVLLPLIVQSLHRGQAIEWGMSPVLFVFPELPLYLLAAAVTTTVAAALLLSGVVNVAVLYALLRFVAGRVETGRLAESGAQDPARGFPRPVLAALTGVAVFTLACLVETRPGGNTGELASLYLVTTYYSGTVMALVASVGLVMQLLLARGRVVWPAIVLAVVAALATWSNPLYLLWAAAPIGLALVVVTLVRLRSGPRGAWRAQAVSVSALVVGAVVGYLARAPLSAFIIADKNEYFRWGRIGLSWSFFEGALEGLVTTPGGVAEAVAGGLAVVGSVVASVVVVRRRSSGVAAFGFLFVTATFVVVPLGLLVTGSIATRYGLPFVFAPLVGIVVAVSAARGPAPSGVRRVVAIACAATLVATVVAEVPAGSSVVRAGSRPGDPAAACLTTWTRGKHVTGAAQYWTGRSLQAYGGPSVQLLQVTSDLEAYPWLTNLAPYRGATISYVVVARNAPGDEHAEYWGDALNQLGNPAAVVDCGTYEIYDYRGTPGAARLTREVVQSAGDQAALRGFGW
jgi:hypothetical protein